jgi:hypothetical protein
VHPAFAPGFIKQEGWWKCYVGAFIDCFLHLLSNATLLISNPTTAEDPIDSSESEEESKAAPRDRTHPHTDEVARAESFNPSLHLGALV